MHQFASYAHLLFFFLQVQVYHQLKEFYRVRIHCVNGNAHARFVVAVCAAAAAVITGVVVIMSYFSE